MNTEPLRRIGLSVADVKVYLALLKRGKAGVTEIAEDCGVHRTNIYSILDKLKEMGLVAYFHEDNKMKFKTTDPQNLLNYTKESEVLVQELVPDLKKLQEIVEEKVGVEIMRGEKGMKSAFRDVWRSNETVIGFGISGQLRKYLPLFAKQWMRDMITANVKHRYLYAEGTEFIHPNWDIRILPKEFITPVATMIYGDKVLISIWEPTMLAIVIKSKEVTETYKKHFELLWQIAKKSTRKKSAF